MAEQNKDPAELWIVFGTAANGHPFPFAGREAPESAAFVAGPNPDRHVTCYVPKSELDRKYHDCSDWLEACRQRDDEIAALRSKLELARAVCEAAEETADNPSTKAWARFDTALARYKAHQADSEKT